MQQYSLAAADDHPRDNGLHEGAINARQFDAMLRTIMPYAMVSRRVYAVNRDACDVMLRSSVEA